MAPSLEAIKMATTRAQGIRLQLLIVESQGFTHFEPIGRSGRDRHRVSEPRCYAVLGRRFKRMPWVVTRERARSRGRYE